MHGKLRAFLGTVLLCVVTWSPACKKQEPAPDAGAAEAAAEPPKPNPELEAKKAEEEKKEAEEKEKEKRLAELLATPEDLKDPPKKGEKTSSGIYSRVLRPGDGGLKPDGDDRVLVHYAAWDETGKLIDTTYRRDVPRQVNLGKTIQGWREGLELMTVGERRRLWIPERLARVVEGKRAKPGDYVVFDMELLKLEKTPDPPPDVASPPKAATKLPSGVAILELSPGTGDKTPRAQDEVRVHYAGWTTDGACFDSTSGGEPSSFKLTDVIPGWAEAIQKMVKGQKIRMWIPENMAYKGASGHPKGMLVFEVELVEIISSSAPSGE